MSTIAKMLGLVGAATEDELATALGRLQTEKGSLEVRLSAAEERAKMVEGQLAQLNAAAEVAAQAALAHRVDADIEQLYATGKLAISRDAAGNRVPHPFEASLRAMVKAVGYEGFTAYANSLPQLVPAGTAAQQFKGNAATMAGHRPTVLANPAVASSLAATGVTDEMVQKHNSPEMLRSSRFVQEGI